jgi:crossover junction endodeoxyribonuclease RuvC
MISIGIDIGLTGAVARVDHSGLAGVYDIPTVGDAGKGRRIDGRALILLLRNIIPPGEACVVTFEDIRPRPMGNAGAHGNTMHSQGSLMRSRGTVEAALDIARLQWSVVQPQTWKRAFGLLKKGKDDALDIARTLYPTLVNDLKRKKDHNRAESLLIAHYALRKAAG